MHRHSRQESIKPSIPDLNFRSNVQFWVDFGIPGGAQNRPSGTRNSGWDPSWSLPRTILAPTRQFSCILNRFWFHLGCLWGPFCNISYIFWRISAVVDRLAAFIAAQHCIRTNQTKKQTRHTNQQTNNQANNCKITSKPHSLKSSKTHSLKASSLQAASAGNAKRKQSSIIQ